MENIENDYLQMYEVYNDLQNFIIPHINEEKPLFKFKIDEIIKFAQLHLRTIEQRAHNVHDMLPKETKRILDYKDKQARDVVNNYINDVTYCYDKNGYYEKNIMYLQYESLLNVGFLNICKITSNSDDTKLSFKKDYSLFPKAYKNLNDSLFLHINGTQYLSENEIIRIAIIISHILVTLKQIAYESCEVLKEIKRHKEIEDYFNAPVSINEDCAFSESDIILLKEHNAWKAERVKHLQKIFTPKRGKLPYDEKYFVSRHLMYSDKY